MNDDYNVYDGCNERDQDDNRDDDNTPDSIDDMRAAIKYLKRRMFDCASADQVEAIESRVTMMVRALLDDRATNIPCEPDFSDIYRRLDALEAAFKTTGSELKESVEQLVSKHRDTRNSTNVCIKDIQTLRQDVKELKHKHKQLKRKDGENAVRSAPVPDTTASSAVETNQNDNPVPMEDEADTNADEVYWKDLLRTTYKLPVNVDWSVVRTIDGRQPLVCGRVATRKWYIGREKLHFANQRWNIPAAYVSEFVSRLAEDCPAVRVGGKKRTYKAVIV